MSEAVRADGRECGSPGQGEAGGVEVRVAAQAGACYGVERALRMVEEAVEHTRREGCDAPVRTLGPLIHNPHVVEQLARDGVLAVGGVEELPQGATVVIRSHGVAPAVAQAARERGCAVVDATCPHVKKAHESARLLCEEGYQLVIVGEAGHPEVEGILGNAAPGTLVVNDPAELDGAALRSRVGVVVQTTQSAALLSAVVAAIVPRVHELRVLNTICSATSRRQQAAEELAREADVMVVVGGKNSGNTTRLAEVCRRHCPRTHHIESPEELRAQWFCGARRVGITAGASTPSDQIQAVRDGLERLVAPREP